MNLATCMQDPANRRLLAVAEDQIRGFHAAPFAEIARRCALPEAEVRERLLRLLRAGVVRRVRQTLLSTSLAQGALVAWRLPEERLSAAFEWLRAHDPFTGHIVLRRAESPAAPGAAFRLWTTLKVPTGYGSLQEHTTLLARRLGAQESVLLPVVGMFSLGVGHVRRAGLRPGERLAQAPRMQRPESPVLTPQEWAVLLSLKESLREEEFALPCPWAARAAQLGMSTENYCAVAAELDKRGVIGRFATFLDHTAPADRHSGTGAAGLFLWAVEPGEEERAGGEVGRHICMTHCYWRRGGERFGGAQIMGVAHATDAEGVRAHKAAIDAHLAEAGIRVRYTAIFRSERSEIRPSEISPALYADWLAEQGGGS